MKIYIASSWKNQHAVQLLTHMLRDKGTRSYHSLKTTMKKVGKTLTLKNGC